MSSTAFGSLGYTVQQQALLGSFRPLRRIGALIRLAAARKPTYSASGTILMAQIMRAAAIVCLMYQQRSIREGRSAYDQYTCGLLWAACDKIAAGMRATAYQATGTLTPTLTLKAQASLAVFNGIDLWLTTSDLFNQRYIPSIQGTTVIPPQVSLVFAIEQLLDGALFA